MKNTWKKLMAGTLAAALTLSLTACGGSGAAGAANDGTVIENTEQTEFSIMGAQSALSPGYTDNPVLNQLQEECGISITWDTMSESLGEKVNIAINGGDVPDAFMGVGFSTYDQLRYGKDGTFLDLTPYLTPDIMPNLCAILEKYPEIKAAITMDDGKIYGLPAAERMRTGAVGDDKDLAIQAVPQFAMINKVWLDDLGLEVPTSLDELHDVLKAFKDNDMAAKIYGAAPGSTIPMSSGFDQWCWGQNFLYAGFGFTNWPSDVMADVVLDKDGKVAIESVSDRYRDAITYFHDWYDEGLIDVEMFSQSDTQLIAKCQQGYVGVTSWWEIKEIMGDHADDYVYLPFQTGPAGTAYEGKTGATLRDGGGVTAGQLQITYACESPINLLKFFDKWYDGETVMQLQYGPIDVYFTGKDDNGLWKSITDEEAQAEFGKSAGEVKSINEVAGPKLILPEYYNEVFAMEDRAQERLEDIVNYWLPQIDDLSYYPSDVVLTQDEIDTLDMYRTDFEKAVSEQEGLWLRDGGPTDDEWNAYIAHLTDSCGMEQLLQVYQDAYDRYVAAQG